MFVLKSTYDKLKSKYEEMQLRCITIATKYNNLLDEWNKLVKRVNANGGEEFLRGKATKQQFSAVEIKQLISLCHPDKHGGSKVAEEITKTLLTMRKK